MKAVTRLLLVLAMLAGSISAFASGYDDRGVVNDPHENDRANACFDEATLENRCDTTDLDEDGDVEQWEKDWMWVCGWYLIRYESDMITRDGFPSICEWVLPAEFVPVLIPDEEPTPMPTPTVHAPPPPPPPPPPPITDSDSDGVPDTIDLCDHEPGPIENNGCPYV